MKLSEKIRDLPDKPGCYIMRDRQGRIIYVGKAVSLRKRVQSYFRRSALITGSPKLRGMMKSVCDLDYIVVRNEAEAVLTEGQLIKDYKPRYNVSFRDDKHFLLLKTNTKQPYPKFNLCRIKHNDSAVYFGPYPSSSSARATLDFVEKKFGLRKCAPRIPDTETYTHCIDDIVRYCSAPCIGRITRKQYDERFKEACAFLRGERPKYLKELKEEMTDAAAEMNFERASALRDIIFHLQKTIKIKARIISTFEMKIKDSKTGVHELQKIFRLDHIPHIIEGYDISNISGTYSVASMVCAVDGMPRRNRYRRFRIKTIKGSNDPGMMAEVIRRRFRRLQEQGGQLPDLILLDGGRTQLHAAQDELNKLELNHIPTAGLAKRYEKIYYGENQQPILLPKNSNALKVLQRLRDEAHRFAITYHRNLRNKRIKESALDGIPGIGPKRKQLLLKHFGSVHCLMKAEECQIAKLPGIGYEMAQAIKVAIK